MDREQEWTELQARIRAMECGEGLGPAHAQPGARGARDNCRRSLWAGSAIGGPDDGNAQGQVGQPWTPEGGVTNLIP